MAHRPALWRRLALGALVAVIPAMALPSMVGADDSFVSGSGRADARILRVGPATGQLSLAPSLALALADYTDTVARAEARPADWAALDGSVPEEYCNGPNSEEIHCTDVGRRIPSLRVSTNDPGAADGKRQSVLAVGQLGPRGFERYFGDQYKDNNKNVDKEYNDNGGPAGVFNQYARATQAPVGTSVMSMPGFHIPGFIEFSGGWAMAQSGRSGPQLRQSIGRVAIPRIALGDGNNSVILEGVYWEIGQQTSHNNDPSPQVTGGFTLGAITIQGTRHPNPAPNVLPTLFGAANTALATAGLVLTPPDLHNLSGTGRVTPLGVGIVNSPAGRQTLGAFLGHQPDPNDDKSFEDHYREEFTNPFIEGCAGDEPERDDYETEQEYEEAQDAWRDGLSDCATLILVTDVAIGVFSGAGSLVLEFGGVMAYTEGATFQTFFGALPPLGQEESTTVTVASTQVSRVVRTAGGAMIPTVAGEETLQPNGAGPAVTAIPKTPQIVSPATANSAGWAGALVGAYALLTIGAAARRQLVFARRRIWVE